MPIKNVGLLHPGAMGVTVGTSIRAGGYRVLWASEGRSKSTSARACNGELEDIVSVQDLVRASDAIISVCPPHAAAEVAKNVMNMGFDGIYVDVNAVSPETSRKIMKIVASAGIKYVDGGIIGPPAIKSGQTRLYLSGKAAEDIKVLFEKGNMDAVVIGKEPGRASALKMCYAAWTKGSSAMLLAIRALAESEGVTEALLTEWNISQKGLEARSEGAARGTAPKAWRFVGEMEEIASTFRQAGLPDQFHLGAAELYEKLSGFKNQAGSIELSDVIKKLISP